MPVYVLNPNVTLPYPGLRPFRREETELFFGREEHITRLAEILQQNHFVAVVGPSGCGKSSLVTAGLLPQLEEGHAIPNSGPWHEVTIRPGDRPFARLAEAIVACGIVPGDDDADVSSRIGFLGAFLRRGPLGLIETIDTMAPLNGGNLLIVVDQFEEIFRYHQEASEQEADAFVALLLETVRQARERAIPIYIMLTMRSDYFGDCNQFSGLPEEISQSQFLTPRPNREQRHAAIVGPAAMFGGDVDAALVNRLLNDMGDDPDQLPIMQHALMRMWSLKAEPDPDESEEDHVPQLTTELYEEVGGWENTLSQHADEALDELGDDPILQHAAEVMFRSLTRQGSEQNDVRRPVSVKEVAEAAGVSTDVVKEVAAAFRRSDRSLIVPPLPDGATSGDDLNDDDILDISHESLIRQWHRLRRWAAEEADSAATYRRLEDTAQRWNEGKEAFLQSPGLDIALEWKKTEQPNAAWASRYGSNFDLTMEFLEKSQAEKCRQEEAEEARRSELAAQRARFGKLVKFTLTSVALLTFVTVLAFAFYYKNNASVAMNDADVAENDAEVARQAKIAAEKVAEQKKALLEGARAEIRKVVAARDADVLQEQNESVEKGISGLKNETDKNKVADQLLQIQ